MPYYLLNDDIVFPDPRYCDESDIVAIGGDLNPERLIFAYENGIFPWPHEGMPLLWWSLNPREILLPSRFRYSKSLRRVVKSGRFEVRIDTCFEQVMRGCQQSLRKDGPGTWITEAMVKAYCRLYQMGAAHSFETFYNGQLVGGLYGVSTRNYFCGESMFHTMTDASKVALVRLVEFCTLHGFLFIDAQQETEHLNSLGAIPVPRNTFLDMLPHTVPTPTLRRRWRQHTVALLLGGNQGNRASLMEQAIAKIEEQIGVVSLQSPRYETAPWGFESPLPFLNCAVIVDTDLSSDEVLRRALDIEKELGRQRHPNATQRYSDRPIDIDLIFFDSLCCDTPTLQLPHPRMSQRRFVLQPLADIIPDYLHPVLKKTVCQLLDECSDTSEVKKIDG